MLLSHALRIRSKDVVVLVGGGGKTTLMFRLADELVGAGSHVVTTMTTRIFVGQMAFAPARLMLRGSPPAGKGEGSLLAQLPGLLADHGHVLAAGNTVVEQDKVQGLPPELVDRIAAHPAVDAVIVEADGSRRLPFKAPADHEPVIPLSATIVVPMAGMDVLGQPLSAEHVHRPHLVARLTGAALGDPVTPAMIAAVLAHPRGGAKDVLPGARLVPFLNKVEDTPRLSAAREVARLLLAYPRVDSVAIGAAQSPDPVRETWSRVGAVVLAAGDASRFGALKQLLPWAGKSLVGHVADQALACPDIDRVVVTLGAGAEEVKSALGDRPVLTVSVQDWAQGQSRSVQTGLRAILGSSWMQREKVITALDRPPEASPANKGGALGAVIFLLTDQPGVSPELLSALIQRHRETLAPVVAPRHEGRRGNPVLFDRAVLAEFDGLQGDIGARPILLAHWDELAWVDWPGPEVVQDIDTTADYQPPT